LHFTLARHKFVQHQKIINFPFRVKIISNSHQLSKRISCRPIPIPITAQALLKCRQTRGFT
jgi:hypothetical protein